MEVGALLEQGKEVVACSKALVVEVREVLVPLV